MDFKTRLKEEMEYKGIQHKELAAMANVKPRALLTYVAANHSMPPADVAVRIAQALGVSVEYLVTGEDSMHKNKYAEIQEIIVDLSRLNKSQLDTIKKMIHALV
ncbi:MAG: helix-turn-helix transcriptional regulator [Treponema sp.]|nr:helix-turn-helix transcriptional regulator [Treponema sp.]